MLGLSLLFALLFVFMIGKNSHSEGTDFLGLLDNGSQQWCNG